MTRGEKLSEGAWRSVRSFIVRSSEKWEAVYQRNHFRMCIPCIEYTLESFAVSLHSSRYVCTCARVCMYCMYVCRRLQGKREGWALYCCFLFYWDKFIVGPIRTLSANAINELVQPVFIFLRFSNFSLDIIFCFIATSKAIPNYPSLNIQRMGRKGGTKREEVYYVISFSTGKYGEYAYFQRRGIRIAVYTYSCKRSVFFN